MISFKFGHRPKYVKTLGLYQLYTGRFNAKYISTVFDDIYIG